MHKQTYRYEAIKYPSKEDVFFNVLWHNRDYTAPHWHNGLEILYLLEGSEDCYLGEEECIRMKKGDFLVINSRVVHSVQCPRQCREMLIQIPYPMMKRFIPQIDGLEFVCEKITGKKQRMDTFLVESALSTLAELHPFQSPEETLEFYSQIYHLLAVLVKDFSVSVTSDKMEISEKYMERLGMITSYVKEHYMEEISLQEIARLVSLNPDYFTRFFKKYMGMTFLDYVNSVRMEHVVRDLQRTDLSVQKLLEIHGFTNYKLFMKMYKSRFESTPGKMRRYRKEQKIED
ncbi:helix-turn-helix transcriptional regulator [Blautia sp. BX19]|jgi:AraC-like DNA-binding protein/mannose-6-phosphate isomerase-like protein (cupin superfamily)|nr:helix-turn-helix transcriptional regulator [Blautia tarda]RGF15925.1 AraC family transcriptional regulator [Blautia sp. AM16-16B]RHO03398.1 AraC family transcriptional regulator [Blautia sp. AM22-22LB]RHQ78316.1 AraC family transcriptional regulator [Blautia sp. AF22-5LB]RHS53978.1 AraC family transcriptional regulator [Blautia sp. AM46-5]RHS57855.1 AraC family transcriptional regulator [Blautia sp. AM46-3MH]RHU47124.1 AraC family transcriptional regulator [Blautia sp. TF11-31AT]